MKKSTAVGATSFILFLTLMNPAYAYLDPGTGSLLLQGLIGGIATALALGGMYWRKLISFFRRDATHTQKELDASKD